ncbi:cation transport ATPase [Alcanivorax hongdengensis A-11-3]|uniref:Cation transport ATPase n=1 Tax=Alcanivorax hongdengensis A-11-3 TaxID=1177179 RepID=L0WDZ7_9GAMM|nr:DUF6482 family protein [Alcanivorax hongdengensis]EKF75271.1 cation transport ATPase [Alcanivorax hongdengensis A-11-3]
MEKITVKALKKRHAEHILLRSVTLSVCTVQVQLEGTLYWVVDEQGRVMRFNGPEHANNQLAFLPTDSASLVHQSAHAEMVGQPDGEVAPLDVPYNWRTNS